MIEKAIYSLVTSMGAKKERNAKESLTLQSLEIILNISKSSSNTRISQFES